MPLLRIDYIVTSGGKNILVPIPSVSAGTQICLPKCRFAKVQIFKNSEYLLKCKFSKACKFAIQLPGNGTFSLGHFHPLTQKRKNTLPGGPRWALSNDSHVRFSAAFYPGEQLLCSWLPQQSWQEVGAVFFRFPLAIYIRALYEVAEMCLY